MQKVLFCKIASMKYYNGITEDDEPKNGGSFVTETGDAHEKYNFTPADLEEYNEPVCLGFFETKSNRGVLNQLHIEKIVGACADKHDDAEDGVLVVWCATRDKNMPRVVGWYKNATVYRDYRVCTFTDGYEQYYNVIAKVKDCVLVPWTQRGLLEWEAPTAKKYGFGFGQSMQWYADEPEAQDYVRSLIEKIEKYNGANGMTGNY